MICDCPFSAHLDFNCEKKSHDRKNYIDCLDCINSFKELLDDYLEEIKNGSNQ